MNSSRSMMKRFSIATAGLLFCANALQAATTNTVPYQETFESYTNGTPLCGTNGWYGTDEAQIVTDTSGFLYTQFTNYTAGLDAPITNANHTNFLKLDVAITNAVTSADFTNFVDMLVMPNLWDESFAPDTNGVSTSIYFNTNGHPVIAGSYGTVWTSTKWTTFSPPVWEEISGTTVETGKWVRVTIDLKRVKEGLGQVYWFRTRINGIDQVSTNGHNDGNNSSPKPGPWFKTVTPQPIANVAFQGSGYIDDFQVITNEPISGTFFTISATCSNVNTVTFSPGAQQTKAAGSGASISFTAKIGYSITNAVVDGSEYLGATNVYTWSNIQTNHDILVLTQPQVRNLVVVNTSGYGSPNPPAGTNSYRYNDSITNTMSGSPVILSGGKTQYVCTGWSRTISSPSTGSETNPAPFTIQGNTTNDDTVFTWNWSTQYKLTTAVTGGGSVDVATAFYDPSATFTITATTNSGTDFLGWTGDLVDCDTNTVGMITVSNMATPRSITANFTSSGPSVTAQGTAHSWLQLRYPASNSSDYAALDLLDTDGDGMTTWQEYVAGTDPTNAASVFHIINSGLSNGNVVISWYGTTNNGVTTSFGIYRTTNLLSGWGALYSTQSRSSDGTNMYIEALNATSYFYKVSTTNSL